jgi:hypothetical protein
MVIPITAIILFYILFLGNKNKMSGDDGGDTVDDLIKKADDAIDKYCNGNKTGNFFKGWGSGIGAMFGLSGVPGCGPPGQDASELLNQAKLMTQDMVQTNTLNFAKKNVQVQEDLHTELLSQSTLANTHMDGIDKIMEMNKQLGQAEIFGAYILIFMILFFILLT